MDDIAQQFLETYARGEMIPGGWLFPKALQQSRLDDSDESLARLDHLMASIRDRVKPSREILLDTEPGRNFCSLIAFYLVAQLRRRTGAWLQWHDRDSARTVLPADIALPEDSFARLIARAPDQGALFVPLGWVESRALGEGEQLPAADYLASMVAKIERLGPAHWWEAVEALGRLAAWQMMGPADGRIAVPTLVSASNPRQFVALAFPGITEDLGEAVQQGADRLEANPDGARWQVLSYDGWLDGESGRQDAVMVALQTYGPSPLLLKVGFPYRPAADGQPFAILQARVLGANQEPGTLDWLLGAMQRGIQSIQWPDGRSWDQYHAAEAGTRHGPVPPQAAQAELEQILIKLRASFEQRQKRMSDLSLASVLASKPDWMEPADALNEVFQAQRRLLTEGHVVWGSLVQANTLLFEPGTADCPALLVHSQEGYFDAHPAELRLIGQAFFALKGTTPADAELQALAQLVTDEMDRSLSFELPQVFSSRPLRSSVFMVFRKHVPNGVLSCGLFPILTHPSTPAVMMLPFEFWPIELIMLWKEGRL